MAAESLPLYSAALAAVLGWRQLSMLVSSIVEQSALPAHLPALLPTARPGLVGRDSRLSLDLTVLTARVAQAKAVNVFQRPSFRAGHVG